jgi:hypothetical protein
MAEHIVGIIFCLDLAQSWCAIEIYNFIRLITMGKIDVSKASQLVFTLNNE